ncbi:MAG: hypothetical protein LBE49_09290 [Deltaproteobacteria bacterium]|jgi:hypothetical protein|nr:hypothetical protein [Deltaproteobacteria bacterium]
MIGPVNRGNIASIWATASFRTALHSERTNVTQYITKSEAQAMAHNTVGPMQRYTYLTPQVAPAATGRHLKGTIPDITKQNYSALADAQSRYHAGDYLPQNYNALGQVSQIADQASAGVVINRVI